MCQTNGRFPNSAQCCLKNSSRSQSARFFFLLPACSSSSFTFAGDHALAERRGEQLLHTIRRRRLTRHRRQAHDPVGIGEHVEIVGLRPAPATDSRPAARPRPATAPSTPPAAPRTTTASDHPTTAPASGPASSATCRQRSTSNGTLRKRRVRDLDALVDRSDRSCELRRLTERPNGRQISLIASGSATATLSSNDLASVERRVQVAHLRDEHASLTPRLLAPLNCERRTLLAAAQP